MFLPFFPVKERFSKFDHTTDQPSNFRETNQNLALFPGNLIWCHHHSTHISRHHTDALTWINNTSAFSIAHQTLRVSPSRGCSARGRVLSAILPPAFTRDIMLPFGGRARQGLGGGISSGPCSPPLFSFAVAYDISLPSNLKCISSLIV